MQLGIGARELDGVGARIARPDLELRRLDREGDGDRARPGADVGDAGSLGAVEEREAPLDDDLRLGPRHERTRIRLERQPAEVPVAEHVGERLAAAAALHQLARRGALRFGHRPVVLRVELDACQRERAGEQQLRVDACRLDSASGEVVGSALQDFGEGHPSSARRCWSAVSASVYSSSSPCRTWSSRCVVSLIRWSVTRFSGKL